MKPRIVIAVIGISGVGKSTSIKSAQEKIQFTHLEASKIIMNEKHNADKMADTRDNLRKNDIDDNQKILVSGFFRCAPEEGVVVLDGHTVIDTPEGLVEIPPSIFSAIGVSGFIALIDDIKNIALRRTSDPQRRRPERSLEHLFEQQERSIIAANRASLALKVPLFVVPLKYTTNIAQFISILSVDTF